MNYVSDIKAIVFDLDGVIIDSELQYLLMQLEVLHEDGLDVIIEDLYPLVGLEWDLHYDYLEKLYDGRKSGKEIKHDYVEYYKDHKIDYTTWAIESTIEAIKDLYGKGYPLAIASNSSYNNIINVISQLEISDYFDFIVSADSINFGKPHPEIYDVAAKKLGLDPKQCLAIEDSISGIQSAKKSGYTVVAIKDEKFNIDQAEADIIVDNLDKIIDLF